MSFVGQPALQCHWYKSPDGRWQSRAPEEEPQTDGQRQSSPQPAPLGTQPAHFGPSRHSSGVLHLDGHLSNRSTGSDHMQPALVQARRSASTSAIVQVSGGQEPQVPDPLVFGTGLNHQKLQATEDTKSQFLERYTTKIREEVIAECTRVTAASLAYFQKELEESKASARQTATTTLTTLEELAKTSQTTNVQMQAELERMQARNELAMQESEKLSNEVIELRSWCINRGGPAGLEGLNPDQQPSIPAFAVRDLREELRQDHVKTKKCISELVCGIEEVAQALAEKDQVWCKRFEVLQKDLHKIASDKGVITLTPGSRTCSSAAWPLHSVGEVDGEVEQPSSWEQEFAREVVSMRMQLEYLQGDVAELRHMSKQLAEERDTKPNVAGATVVKEGQRHVDGNDAAEGLRSPKPKETGNVIDDFTGDVSTIEAIAGVTPNSSLPDEIRALCSQLQERLDEEHRVAMAASNDALDVVAAKLSGELTEAKTEVAEALGLVHEAVRLGEVLKREIESERKERLIEIRKLCGRLDGMEKVKLLPSPPTMPPPRTVSGVPPIA